MTLSNYYYLGSKSLCFLLEEFFFTPEPAFLLSTGWPPLAPLFLIFFDVRSQVARLALEVVGVAERNGVKLPREFGILLKQVSLFRHMSRVVR